MRDEDLINRILTVLILESELNESDALAQYVKTTDDVHIVGITSDVNKALNYVKNFSPDAIIMDTELLNGNGNGIDFLLRLPEVSHQKLPFILITTNNTSSMIHKKLWLLGADFIMIKNHLDYSAAKVINFLCSMRDIILCNVKHHKLSAEQSGISPVDAGNNFKAQVTAELNLLGISPKLIGRDYLIEAILLAIDGKRLFATFIAQNHIKSKASVERAMQNAVNNLWDNGNLEALQKQYTIPINSQKGSPTVCEFVFYFADKIRLNQQT